MCPRVRYSVVDDKILADGQVRVKGKVGMELWRFWRESDGYTASPRLVLPLT